MVPQKPRVEPSHVRGVTREMKITERRASERDACMCVVKVRDVHTCHRRYRCRCRRGSHCCEKDALSDPPHQRPPQES